MQPVISLSMPGPRFVETPTVRRRLGRERLARILFGVMVALMLLPLLAIVSYLIYKGAPLISWDFLTTNPQKSTKAPRPNSA